MTSKWYKGNLHTHTTNSDGDATPSHVAEWYRSNGYDFLCISDHNHLTILNDSNQKRWPLLIPGEEVTSAVGKTPVHVNGYGINELVEPSGSNDVVTALSENVQRIVAAGGLASINHPNYKWAFGYNQLVKVSGYRFIEVYNGHHLSNSDGDLERPSVSNIWDQLLTSGKKILGLAVDDSHNYHEIGPDLSNPGRGWIQVKVNQLSKNSILQAMSQGNYYASTGVELGELVLNKKQIRLEIDESATKQPNEKPDNNQSNFITSFIGVNGTVLHVEKGVSSKYIPSKKDLYIRCEILNSKTGQKLWTQPFWME